MTTGRAILIGAGAALVAVAIAVALVASGVLRPVSSRNAEVSGPVLVALVLPNEAGQVEPRVIDVYTRTSSGWSISSVSPSLPVVVSGTSGQTLADAYTFGGGRGLAEAYSSLGRGTATSWVVVDEGGWKRLLGPSPVPLDLPARMEVFDGRQLLAYEGGPISVPSTQTALILDGAHYLSTGEGGDIRRQIGDLLGSALMASSSGAQTGLASSLTSAQLLQWTGTLANRARASGD